MIAIIATTTAIITNKIAFDFGGGVLGGGVLGGGVLGCGVLGGVLGGGVVD